MGRGVQGDDDEAIKVNTPTKAVLGTKMGFQGLLYESDRQTIISYLKGLKNKK